MQPHLNKAFEGIAKVKFEKDLKISEMRAAKGEVVVMDEPVDPEKGKNHGNVECWLLEVCSALITIIQAADLGR